MSEIIDYSDKLGRVSALVLLLTDFDPDGQWQRNAIYKKRKRSRYSLTQNQFLALSVFLETEWERVQPKPGAKTYVQINLLE